MILAFLIGTIIGSFLSVVSLRVPKNESLLFPASHCDNCQHRLRPFELIPLISALRQNFQCTHCQQKFSTRSFWLEFFCGILCFLFLHKFDWLNLWRLFWLLSSLTLAVIDWDSLIVEMRIFYLTGSLLLLSGLFLLPINWFHPLIVCTVFYLSQKIRPNSFGLGDLWVLGLWSFFLSSYELLLVLFIASLTGLGFYGYRSIQQKRPERLPFLPFLFIGLLVLLSTH